MGESARTWRVLKSEVVLAAPPWLTVEREAVELPSGRIIPDFYQIHTPDFVAVVPIAADGTIILVRGYKHGVRHSTLSIPAGLIEEREAPLIAAQRELLEETGYEAALWHALGTYVVDGNRGNGRMHAFLARGVRKVASPAQDDSEELQVECLTRVQVTQALLQGEFATLTGASAVSLALVWLDAAIKD